MAETSATPAMALLLGRALLVRIQPKRFELARPFGRSIAQPRDVDAPRQTALDGGAVAVTDTGLGGVGRCHGMAGVIEQ